MDELRHIGGVSIGRDAASRWTFFTNHFLVLTCVADNPDSRVRDIAARVGITERATQTILGDLVNEGFLERVRVGRRNHYEVVRSATFRHALMHGTTLGEVLDVVLSNGRRTAAH